MAVHQCTVGDNESIVGGERRGEEVMQDLIRPMRGLRRQREPRVMAAGIALLLLCVTVASLHQHSARTEILGLDTWVAGKRVQSIAMMQSNIVSHAYSMLKEEDFRPTLKCKDTSKVDVFNVDSPASLWGYECKTSHSVVPHANEHLPVERWGKVAGVARPAGGTVKGAFGVGKTGVIPNTGTGPFGPAGPHGWVKIREPENEPVVDGAKAAVREAEEEAAEGEVQVQTEDEASRVPGTAPSAPTAAAPSAPTAAAPSAPTAAAPSAPSAPSAPTAAAPLSTTPSPDNAGAIVAPVVPAVAASGAQPASASSPRTPEIPATEAKSAITSSPESPSTEIPSSSIPPPAFVPEDGSPTGESYGLGIGVTHHEFKSATSAPPTRHPQQKYPSKIPIVEPSDHPVVNGPPTGISDEVNKQLGIGSGFMN